MLEQSRSWNRWLIFEFLIGEFYWPLDLVIALLFLKLTTMATSNTYSHDLSSHKHGDIKVNVAEIEPDISTTEYDELTLFAPDSQPQKTSTIQQPHGNLGPFPQSGKRHEFRRPSSPTGSVRSSFTSRRRVSRGLSWSSGFSRSHSSEVSRELTVEAESE